MDTQHLFRYREKIYEHINEKPRITQYTDVYRMAMSMFSNLLKLLPLDAAESPENKKTMPVAVI
jgi:hypothetical protein